MTRPSLPLPRTGDGPRVPGTLLVRTDRAGIMVVNLELANMDISSFMDHETCKALPWRSSRVGSCSAGRTLCRGDRPDDELPSGEVQVGDGAVCPENHCFRLGPRSVLRPVDVPAALVQDESVASVVDGA
ncbi:hypothetical protein GCM10009551_014280 [Nocardiopsis tropica]